MLLSLPPGGPNGPAAAQAAAPAAAPGALHGAAEAATGRGASERSSLDALLRLQAMQRPGRRAWLSSLAFAQGLNRFPDWAGAAAGFQHERQQLVEVATTALLASQPPLAPGAARRSPEGSGGSSSAPACWAGARSQRGPAVGVLFVHYCVGDDAAPQRLLGGFADEVGAAICRLRSQPGSQARALRPSGEDSIDPTLLSWAVHQPAVRAFDRASAHAAGSPEASPAASLRSNGFPRVTFSGSNPLLTGGRPSSGRGSSFFRRSSSGGFANRRSSSGVGVITRAESGGGGTFEEELVNSLLPASALAALREGLLPDNVVFEHTTIVFSGGRLAPLPPYDCLCYPPPGLCAAAAAAGRKPSAKRAEIPAHAPCRHRHLWLHLNQRGDWPRRRRRHAGAPLLCFRCNCGRAWPLQSGHDRGCGEYPKSLGRLLAEQARPAQARGPFRAVCSTSSVPLTRRCLLPPFRRST